MERYHLTRSFNSEGYDLSVVEVVQHDPALIPVLTELDLLSYAEPTFSRYTLGGLMRFGRLFIIKANELVIGACHTFRSYENPNEIVVFNMALRPGWRGHGLGSRLLRGVVECLHRDGVASVVLAVASTNRRAIGVYQTKFGFEQVEVLPNEFHNGHPYHLMRLDVARWAERELLGIKEN
jgi:ribosomal-protein-alanine N-acetyltransferase